MSRSGESLGYRLIVAQALPIRAVLGFLYLQVFPLPIWSGFDLKGSFYHWAKSLQPIYMVYLLGLSMAAAVTTAKQVRGQIAHVSPVIFLVTSFVLGSSSVALTSLETRHSLQFLPFLIAFASAVVPTARLVNHWCLIVGAGIVSINLLWVAVKSV